MSVANILPYFLGLFPAAGVISQTLLDATMFLIAFSWLFIVGKQKFKQGIGIKAIGIEWAFVGYLLTIGMGFYANYNPEVSYLRSFSKFSWILNLYILVYALRISEIDLRKALIYVCGILFIPTVYSLVCYAWGVDLLTGRENSRISGFVNSPTYHAHGNAMLFVFLINLLVALYKKLARSEKLFTSLAVFLLGASIYLTYTRGVWISIFLSSLIMASIVLEKKKVMVVLFASTLAFIGLYFGSARFKERAVHATNFAANDERVNLFKVNVQIWKEYPLLGIGYGENVRRNREYWNRPEWLMHRKYITSHAHNQYLNVLATTGILGFVFFISFVGFFLLKNIRLLRKASKDKSSNHYILLFSCLWLQIEFLLAGLTDVGFEYAKIRAIFVFAWALVIAIEYKMLETDRSKSENHEPSL